VATDMSDTFIQVRVRRGVGVIKLNSWRRLHEHGRFGPCHMVLASRALELHDRGLVSLRPGLSPARLREQLDEASAA
jgi:hypothetical protein